MNSLSQDELQRLADLLALAAQRGAYRIDEFEAVGLVYNSLLSCLQSPKIQSSGSSPT